jgi:hypothetical protein
MARIGSLVQYLPCSFSTHQTTDKFLSNSSSQKEYDLTNLDLDLQGLHLSNSRIVKINTAVAIRARPRRNERTTRELSKLGSIVHTSSLSMGAGISNC